MIAFRGEKNWGPRPDWSPLEIENFRQASPALSYGSFPPGHFWSTISWLFELKIHLRKPLINTRQIKKDTIMSYRSKRFKQLTVFGKNKEKAPQAFAL